MSNTVDKKVEEIEEIKNYWEASLKENQNKKLSSFFDKNKLYPRPKRRGYAYGINPIKEKDLIGEKVTEDSNGVQAVSEIVVNSQTADSKFKYKTKSFTNEEGYKYFESTTPLAYDPTILSTKEKEPLSVTENEELIVNIEELADELTEEAMKNKDNTLLYKELLEKYKTLILKHERRNKE